MKDQLRHAFALALITALSGPANSQEMKSLAETSADAATPYLPARCAGLYEAMMEWVGVNRMGDATWASMDATRRGMIVLSAQASQKSSGGTIEHHVGVTIRDVRNIKDLYISRMESNYASIGQAFSEDKVISGDLVFCKGLADLLNGSR